jgi:L-histidine N-alpha-methyltransferase
MESENHPSILYPSRQHLWRPIAHSIWTAEGAGEEDPALSLLRTLLDQPRWIEAYHLYDERGSELFEQICALPEYYPTRTENSILEREAGRIIAAAPVDCIVELGAGSAQKTLHLLREQARQRNTGIFAPIDVSLSGLLYSRDTVSQRFPRLGFQGLHSRYEDGVAGIDRELPTLFVFLGSSIGNFSHPELIRFFDHLSQSMGDRDFLLLGVDRVKDREVLERAYNDSAGVTARFILNVFHNVNRILGTDFDIGAMSYHSWYNAEWKRVEMYAVSNRNQEIHFPNQGISIPWPKQDRILVEISRKFDPLQLQQQLRSFNLETLEHFTDPREWFSLLLLKKS